MSSNKLLMAANEFPAESEAITVGFAIGFPPEDVTFPLTITPADAKTEKLSLVPPTIPLTF